LSNTDITLLLLSLHFTGHFSRLTILDFIGTKDDGGGDNNWSYKTILTVLR